MQIHYLLIPLLTAFTAWFTFWLPAKMIFHPRQAKKIFGVTVQGIVPRNMPQVIGNITAMAEQMFSFKQIEEKITHHETVEKIMPLAEEHIDDFLRNKLVKAMPMIGMFIGDRTINQLKEIFMDELRVLFPPAIKSYAANVWEDINVNKAVREKIATLFTERIEPALKKSILEEIRKISLLAAVFGLIVGLLQLMIVEMVY